MFDLLGVVKQNISGDPTWATPQTAKTGLVFAAAIFWALLLRHVALFAYIWNAASTPGTAMTVADEGEH